MSETKNLAQALVAFQADLKPVDKSSSNPFFRSKYADLTEVKTSVQPLLTAHKLAVTQWPTTLDGKPALRTRVMHESGESDEDVMLLMLDKENPQGQGSAITYARRYAFMAALGIVADEDDDANKASHAKEAVKYAPVAAKPQERPLPSENQLSKIRELSRELGYDESAVEERIGEIETTGDAMKAIAKLQELVNAGNK
jgi:ERF superfamily protein